MVCLLLLKAVSTWMTVGRLPCVCCVLDAVGRLCGHVHRLLVCACVGGRVGAEFMTFVEIQALPDSEDVVAAPQSLTLPRRGETWPWPSSDRP